MTLETKLQEIQKWHDTVSPFNHPLFAEIPRLVRLALAQAKLIAALTTENRSRYMDADPITLMENVEARDTAEIVYEDIIREEWT